MHSRIRLFEEIATAKGIPKYPFHICVSNELSSRLVSKQVFSPLQSLTSVFGMGTGGPSALKSPTVRLMLSLEINCLQFIRHCRTNYGTERIKRNVCVSNELSSRLVSKQVSSPQQSLTSVFGMGTGGPSAVESLIVKDNGVIFFLTDRIR